MVSVLPSVPPAHSASRSEQWAGVVLACPALWWAVRLASAELRGTLNSPGSARAVTSTPFGGSARSAVWPPAHGGRKLGRGGGIGPPGVDAEERRVVHPGRLGREPGGAHHHEVGTGPWWQQGLRTEERSELLPYAHGRRRVGALDRDGPLALGP